MRRMFSKKQIEKWIDDKIGSSVDWNDFNHSIKFSSWNDYKISVKGYDSVAIAPIQDSELGIRTYRIFCYKYDDSNPHDSFFQLEDNVLCVYKETSILHYALDYKIPKITFNGNINNPTSITFYAPVSKGEKGQLIASSGDQVGNPIWSKYFILSEDKQEQTKDTLFALVNETYDTIHISNVAFASSEILPVQNYEVEIHKTGEGFGYIIAKNRRGCFIADYNNGTWSAWKQFYNGVKDFEWTYLSIDSSVVEGGQWRICCKSGIVYIEAQEFKLKGHGTAGAVNNARIGFGIPSGYEPQAIEVRGLLSYNYGKDLLQNCWISANSTELYSFQRQNDYTHCRLFISYPIF